MNITYTLEMNNPHTHFFRVKMKLDDVSEERTLLTMPAWTPGSYAILDFARNVRKLQAVSESGAPLVVTKKDKSTWIVASSGIRNMEVSYEVYADEFSVHTSHLDSTHAFVLGTSVFLYIEGYKDQAVELSVSPPPEWKISTGLEKIGENRFRAVNYDILVDSPLEIGTHRSFFFEVDGKQHEIAIYGHGNENETMILNDVQKIVSSFSKMFNQYPFKRYVFIYHLVQEGGQLGGLEHLNSTTIDIERFSFSPRDRYLDFLSVTSHEYFHLWNVKRIRPIELGPFNYKEENYTTMLWVSEGITSYYEWIALFRAGLITEEEYLKHILEYVRYYELLPGSAIESASDSSFDSWIKLYRPSPNNTNSYLSYYLKGEILGFLLSSRISEATGGSKSLDDVMRHLYEKYKKDGKGFVEKDLLSALRDVSGKDFSEFYSRYVRGTEKIDFDAETARIGVKIKKGYRKIDNNEPAEKSYMGIFTKSENGKIFVSSVLEGSPAFQAGINAGDELVAINRIRFSDLFLKNIREDLRSIKTDNPYIFKPGDRVKVDLFRRGMLYTLEVQLAMAPPEYYEPILDREEKTSAIRSRVFQGFNS
ncbi:MAG: PDZ domain-containing protein [Candidatus Thermoplasmatota archaeon]|nr:PDZ domain-containing protein [Candidatus Thermoplasmatota archaeon]